MNRPPASGKKGVYPPATCQELAIPFAMSAIHVLCEEARQPHRPAVMHAGSRVRRNKVRATVMGAGVAQCAVAGWTTGLRTSGAPGTKRSKSSGTRTRPTRRSGAALRRPWASKASQHCTKSKGVRRSVSPPTEWGPWLTLNVGGKNCSQNVETNIFAACWRSPASARHGGDPAS